MVQILAKVCKGEGWGFCRYMGDMSHDSRSKAIYDFTNEPSKNILICGLKCGGLGLNLTAATKVLLVDPWWNAAVENQAFARYVHYNYDVFNAH
jgi:SNF2 family DNA or RNA helicase